MGRKKKRPTKVLSVRISKKDFEQLKLLAMKSGKSVSQLWKEILQRRIR